MSDEKSYVIGAVAIGRNEGARLEACLKSLVDIVEVVVYVDSGSTDNSVAMAKGLGVVVVDLDTTIPFTAARARNAGFAELRRILPSNNNAFIQFVDGDCEVVDDWIEAAARFLQEQENVASVCGRRRERFPEASVYNRLCDIEWGTSIGETKSTGGDFLIRAEAYSAVEGFNDTLIAGEEPDLCFRLREAGWKIWRIDEEMTLHDAAMSKINQWWQRNKRAGYAYANGHHLHGQTPERFRQREVMRAIVFGAGLPFIVLMGLLAVGPAALLLLFIYVAQAARTYVKLGHLSEGRFAYAVSCTVAKIPEFFGALKFWRAHASGAQSTLIEYK